MSSLETKPVPSGSKKSSSGQTESWRNRSQSEMSSQNEFPSIRWRSKGCPLEKNTNTFNILDDWDPNRSGMATHIEFIHQSMMDLASGIEKINSVDNNLQIINDQLTIMKNHLIRMEGRQEYTEKLFEKLEKNQKSLCEGQQTIIDRLDQIEERLKNKTDDSVDKVEGQDLQQYTTEEYLQKLLSDTISDINHEYQSMLSENIEDVISILIQMEERIKKKIEDSKVELSATFETEAEVCRNIYINELMDQVNSLKGRGSCVRYVGKKETQGISRLSSMLPSFGDEITSKQPSGVTVVLKERK